MIFIRPELNWLSGIFASPMPREGCSTGFSRGCVKQKTYDLFNYANSWSTSISNRLSCKVNTGYITTCFCVKVARKLKQNEFAWPSGSYCIARKKAFCPAGFRQGSIKWDDKDIFNNNEHWGELPDGEYNKDTKIFFCCRSDGSYKIPIRMPVGMPFVLYRYGGHCQKVMNMSVQEDYIKWVGELVSFIWDKRSGNHPDDDGGSKNYLLHYCHYSNS